MTPEEARQLIGLDKGFCPDDLEAAFHRHSRELESKIERAPTPGLKEKYRRSLNLVEEAWEILSEASELEASPNFPSLQPTLVKEGPIDPVVIGGSDSTNLFASMSNDKPSSNLPRTGWLSGIAIALVVLILSGLGYYYGFASPEGKARRAEAAQREAEAKALTAEIEKQKADEAAMEAKTDEEKKILEQAKQDAEARAAAAEKAAEQAKEDAEKAKQAELTAAQASAAITPPVALNSSSPLAPSSEVDDFRAKAAAGDVMAARTLGIAYYSGRGVRQDYAEALKWLQMAADGGNATAQDFIGSMYENGLGRVFKIKKVEV